MAQPAFDKKNKQKGFVLMLSVLVIGAVAMLVSLALIVLGTDAVRTAFSLNEGKRSLALADACAEHGLQLLHDSLSYTGTGTLTIGSYSCTYEVINSGGSNREVRGTSTYNNYTRRVKVLINQTSPKLNVSSWRDVASF